MQVTHAREMPVAGMLCATIDGVEMHVPANGNRYHQAILDAVAAGTLVVEPAPVRSEVPASVPRWRIRMALLTRGLLDTADAAADAAGGSVRIFWRDALEIERAHPLIPVFGALLGLTTEAAIDDVFLDAMTY